MKKEKIISTEDTLGGSPRLGGRRLDVRHVIWGIIEFDNANIESYQDEFEVTKEQIRHAIMYCKDEICELQEVPQSCNGCSKKFRKDIETWDEYIRKNWGIDKIETDDELITKLGDNSILLGDLEDHKWDFKGVDSWERAETIYQKLKGEFNLPETYEKLINEK